MKATDKVYMGRVIEDNGELLLEFPFEMISELQWKEGDTIVWDIDEENKILLARKEKPEQEPNV